MAKTAAELQAEIDALTVQLAAARDSERQAKQELQAEKKASQDAHKELQDSLKTMQDLIKQLHESDKRQRRLLENAGMVPKAFPKLKQLLMPILHARKGGQ